MMPAFLISATLIALIMAGIASTGIEDRRLRALLAARHV